jgi:hypothetical protein
MFLAGFGVSNHRPQPEAKATPWPSRAQFHRYIDKLAMVLILLKAVLLLLQQTEGTSRVGIITTVDHSDMRGLDTA